MEVCWPWFQSVAGSLEVRVRSGSVGIKIEIETLDYLTNLLWVKRLNKRAQASERLCCVVDEVRSTSSTMFHT